MLTSAKRQQSSLMLQGTEQPLGEQGSSMRSGTEIAMLTFKGQRCPKREVKSRISVSNGQGWILHSKFRSSVHFTEHCCIGAANSWSSFVPGKTNVFKKCCH